MLNELVKAAGNKTKLERKKFVYAKKIFSWLADSATTKKISKFVEQRKKKKRKKIQLKLLSVKT